MQNITLQFVFTVLLAFVWATAFIHKIMLSVKLHMHLQKRDLS